MALVTRRTALQLGASAAALGVSGGFALAQSNIKTADATPPKLDIEKGATLRMLRPVRFVEPDEVIFRANCAKFAKDTGVEVKVDFVGWEDITQQTAVTANTGAGPDLIVGFNEAPHIYTDKLVDLSDVAEYIGKRYGGWLPMAQKYGKKHGTNNWIGLPFGASGGPLVWRKSAVNAVGYDAPPDDHDRYLDLCRKLHAAGKPPGFALGNAVGDGNGFASWLIWSHGGFLVDEDNSVAINRKETIEALKYLQELYKTFIPGTIAWGDISNNRAYAANEILADGERRLNVFRAEAGREAGFNRRGYPAQPAAQGPPERVADGGPHAQRDGVPTQQVPECVEGAAPVPAGEGAIRSLAAGEPRLLVAAARELFGKCCLERRSEGLDLPQRDAEQLLGRL